VAKAIVPTSGRNPEEIVEDVLDTVPGPWTASAEPAGKDEREDRR